MTIKKPVERRNYIKEFAEALVETGRYLVMIARAFRFWHRDPPVETVEQATRFAETRSKFVAQITLFGYIKTRSGTRYTALFTDEVYAKSINIAKWEIYLACLADAVLYLTARIGAEAGATRDEMDAMALHMLNAALDHEEIPAERPQGFDDIREAFALRVPATPWETTAADETVFNPSLKALVAWAPIADELKALDAKVVKNSMRFKWKKVRDQADQLLNSTAVMADWRAGGRALAKPQETEPVPETA